MGSARDAAIEYFRCMREADADGIERLFAPDAFLSICDGTFRRSRADPRLLRDHGHAWSAAPQSPETD